MRGSIENELNIETENVKLLVVDKNTKSLRQQGNQ